MNKNNKSKTKNVVGRGPSTPTHKAITVTTKQNKKQRRTPFGHNEPYNFNVKSRLKQCVILKSINEVVGGTPIYLDLISSLAPGETDNQRLSETVISDYIECRVIARLDKGEATGPAFIPDCAFRMLIVGTIESTYINPLSVVDPFGTVNNTVDPSQVVIFYDSGVRNLTASTGGIGPTFTSATSCQQIDHTTFTMNSRVNLHKGKNIAGMFTRFDGSAVSTGLLYAMFLSDDPPGTDSTLSITTAFSVGFRDYVPDITAGLSQRVAAVEGSLESKMRTLLSEMRQKELEDAYNREKQRLSRPSHISTPDSPQ